MFQSKINVNDNYYYMPFGPVMLSPKDVGLKRMPFTTYFVQEKSGTKWVECLLYNTGWGQPVGFERLPKLKFEDLLKLALTSDYKTTTLTVNEEESNKYGAIAVIMERYRLELIDFLAININNNDLWGNDLYCSNLKLFCFDDFNCKGNGGIGRKSYEEILNECPKWCDISQRVKELVYGN
jgi:hypothetical protein